LPPSDAPDKCKTSPCCRRKADFCFAQAGTQIAHLLMTQYKENSMKALVIGAGIGGLSAAVA
jgi:heterodisulfide reductase subunit A-like polyferredoxin